MVELTLSHLFPEVQHVALGKINHSRILDHDVIEINNVTFFLGDRHNNTICRKWKAATRTRLVNEPINIEEIRIM